ncbi:MAG: zinc metallopeptidase [Tissierellia bacterium]|jgi:Zn-dependent membrane protease YugP|nr:zinc metallopeptidase [Bacillota bacterium]NLL22633.1 zinc metallopeptidase [Tissierellia bacterium]
MYDSTFLIILPFILLGFWASSNVQSTFHKYSKVYPARGMTGAEVAQMLIDRHGLDVRVERATGGGLSDHYDPRTHVVRLSNEVHDSRSISAVSVAAHEIGHAIQDAEGYQALRLRNNFFPVVSFGSNVWMLLFMLGIILSLPFLTNLGILFFGMVVVFQLITLPVEFNASTRALAILQENGVLTIEEAPAAKKVLKAAALTYVVAALSSIANLVRLLSLSGRRR